MEPLDIEQRGRGPNKDRHSNVRFGWLNVVALLKLSHPGIGLIGSHMTTIATKIFPSFQRVPTERLALLFSLDVLGNRLAHEPM